MIVYSALNIIIMTVFSYYSKAVPELFLVSVILLAYKKNINKNYLKIYALLGGYFSDVFYFSEYPVHTLLYFIIFMIVFYKLKDFIFFNFSNLLKIFTIVFLLEKFSLMTFDYLLNTKSGFEGFKLLSEFFFSSLFLFFYYKIFIKFKFNR